MDRSTGQTGHVGGGADVIGMEMRDHDALDRSIQPGEYLTPPFARVG
jgi:hypothetical protein